jgi:hypothetical protein
VRQGRNKRRRETPEEIWEQIELEVGPLHQLPQDILQQRLATEMKIASAMYGEQAILVPPEIFERVLTEVMARNRHKISADDTPRLMEVERMLRKLRERDRAAKARPNHRPRKNWYLRRAMEIACHELKLRQRELMWETDEQGKKIKKMSSSDARIAAAEEIAPNCYTTAGTLLSWAANPGRRRRK